MCSNVKQLKRQGIRYKREGDAGPGVEGVLELAHHNGYPCLMIKRWADCSQDAALLPAL
jgi:hypothetical protein